MTGSERDVYPNTLVDPDLEFRVSVFEFRGSSVPTTQNPCSVCRASVSVAGSEGYV